MSYYLVFFFFNDTATTEIYTLSLHDALPDLTKNRQGPDIGSQYRSVIFYHTPDQELSARSSIEELEKPGRFRNRIVTEDRKSTRLNSSHANISYAVFCLKKKKNTS